MFYTIRSIETVCTSRNVFLDGLEKSWNEMKLSRRKDEKLRGKLGKFTAKVLPSVVFIAFTPAKHHPLHSAGIAGFMYTKPFSTLSWRIHREKKSRHNRFGQFTEEISF